MNANGTSIEVRLEALERRCRGLRLWCAVTTSALVVGCAAAAIAPADDVVRARRFEVLGSRGELVAEFGSSDRPGAMLRIGGWEDDGAFAMLGVFPVSDPGADSRRTAAVLQLESASNPDSNIFAAHVSDFGAFSHLTNDFRSIESFIEPGRSCIRMATEDEQEEPPASERRRDDAEDDDAGHVRFEIDLAGDAVELRGQDRDGTVRFRQP